MQSEARSNAIELQLQVMQWNYGSSSISDWYFLKKKSQLKVIHFFSLGISILVWYSCLQLGVVHYDHVTVEVHQLIGFSVVQYGRYRSYIRVPVICIFVTLVEIFILLTTTARCPIFPQKYTCNWLRGNYMVGLGVFVYEILRRYGAY